MSLNVTSTYGKKSGSASIDEFDDASLEKVVRRSEELAQLAPANIEHMPLLGPAGVSGSDYLQRGYCRHDAGHPRRNGR